MIKKHIKKHIVATGTYKLVEDHNKLIKKENQLLKVKLSNSNKSINQLKNKNLQLQKSINNHRLLINTLKAETNSLKQFYLIDTSLAENYDNLTIIMPYRKTDDHEREENLDITLRYLNRIGIKNLIISEYSKISSENLLMQKYGQSIQFFYNNFY